MRTGRHLHPALIGALRAIEGEPEPMALLAVQHAVRNYDDFRAVYDSMGELHHQWGVTAEAVYQLAGGPNTVLILHHFATVAQAKAFLTSRELRAAMQRAGVEGEPRVEIYG